MPAVGLIGLYKLGRYVKMTASAIVKVRPLFQWPESSQQACG
jgi:hypothetical protein